LPRLYGRTKYASSVYLPNNGPTATCHGKPKSSVNTSVLRVHAASFVNSVTALCQKARREKSFILPNFSFGRGYVKCSHTVNILRGTANHHLNRAWFDNIVFCHIVVTQLIHCQPECDLFGLTGCQRNPLEPFQFLDRPCYMRNVLMGIKLDNFVACTRTCILDLNRHSDFAI